MMRIRHLLAAGVIAAGGSALEAQTPAGLDSATMNAIAPIIQRARASNLPLDLLYTRARQGQVQRLPAARIEVAVRNYAERLETAQAALAPNPTTPELKAGVDALQTGVPRETLSEMRRAAKEGSLAVPLGILTTLVARGVSVEKASVQVVALLQQGASPAHFIALDQRVQADVLAGRRPDESLDLRLKGIFPNLPQSVNAGDAATLQAGGTKRPR
jgi:hypothetical protein